MASEEPKAKKQKLSEEEEKKKDAPAKLRWPKAIEQTYKNTRLRIGEI